VARLHRNENGQPTRDPGRPSIITHILRMASSFSTGHHSSHSQQIYTTTLIKGLPQLEQLEGIVWDREQ
jgi:hypothetical protein